MTNKEAVLGVLKEYSCLTSSQIQGFANRMFNVHMSPNSASGIIRPYINQGIIAKSPDPNSGKMVYWLTDYGKEQLNK